VKTQSIVYAFESRGASHSQAVSQGAQQGPIRGEELLGACTLSTKWYRFRSTIEGRGSKWRVSLAYYALSGGGRAIVRCSPTKSKVAKISGIVLSSIWLVHFPFPRVREVAG
jgi:hypothetical protein